MGETWTNEEIISDVLGRSADIELGGKDRSWRLSRWRQFVGSYELPALPHPTFVVHIGGKPKVKTWLRDGWSEASSIPGCATIVPAGHRTGWLVDGELDVVTLSIASCEFETAPARDQFDRLRFAFSDPLGVALTRQVLTELYAPQMDQRQTYVTTLVEALKAHMLHGPGKGSMRAFPTSDFSSFRIHHIMNCVLERPEGDHNIEALAEEAGLTPSHFCRVFKRATGMSPHKFVMKSRLERAQELLAGSSLSIAQVAEAMGFKSQSHFTRSFREFSGQTPSVWRTTGLQ